MGAKFSKTGGREREDGQPPSLRTVESAPLSTQSSPRSSLKRRPSLGKRFRNSCRKWVSERGASKQANQNEQKQITAEVPTKPSSLVLESPTQKEETVPEIKVVDVEEPVCTEDKEPDIGAVVAQLVVEAHKKKIASRTLSKETVLDKNSNAKPTELNPVNDLNTNENDPIGKIDKTFDLVAKDESMEANSFSTKEDESQSELLKETSPVLLQEEGMLEEKHIENELDSVPKDDITKEEVASNQELATEASNVKANRKDNIDESNIESEHQKITECSALDESIMMEEPNKTVHDIVEEHTELFCPVDAESDDIQIKEDVVNKVDSNPESLGEKFEDIINKVDSNSEALGEKVIEAISEVSISANDEDRDNLLIKKDDIDQNAEEKSICGESAVLESTTLETFSVEDRPSVAVENDAQSLMDEENMSNTQEMPYKDIENRPEQKSSDIHVLETETAKVDIETQNDNGVLAKEELSEKNGVGNETQSDNDVIVNEELSEKNEVPDTLIDHETQEGVQSEMVDDTSKDESDDLDVQEREETDLTDESETNIASPENVSMEGNALSSVEGQVEKFDINENQDKDLEERLLTHHADIIEETIQLSDAQEIVNFVSSDGISLQTSELDDQKNNNTLTLEELENEENEEDNVHLLSDTETSVINKLRNDNNIEKVSPDNSDEVRTTEDLENSTVCESEQEDSQQEEIVSDMNDNEENSDNNHLCKGEPESENTDNVEENDCTNENKVDETDRDNVYNKNEEEDGSQTEFANEPEQNHSMTMESENAINDDSIKNSQDEEMMTVEEYLKQEDTKDEFEINLDQYLTKCKFSFEYKSMEDIYQEDQNDKEIKNADMSSSSNFDMPGLSETNEFLNHSKSESGLVHDLGIFDADEENNSDIKENHTKEIEENLLLDSTIVNHEGEELNVLEEDIEDTHPTPTSEENGYENMTEEFAAPRISEDTETVEACTSDNSFSEDSLPSFTTAEDAEEIDETIESRIEADKSIDEKSSEYLSAVFHNHISTPEIYHDCLENLDNVFQGEISTNNSGVQDNSYSAAEIMIPTDSSSVDSKDQTDESETSDEEDTETSETASSVTINQHIHDNHTTEEIRKPFITQSTSVEDCLDSDINEHLLSFDTSCVYYPREESLLAISTQIEHHDNDFEDEFVERGSLILEDDIQDDHFEELSSMESFDTIIPRGECMLEALEEVDEDEYDDEKISDNLPSIDILGESDQDFATMVALNEQFLAENHTEPTINHAVIEDIIEDIMEDVNAEILGYSASTTPFSEISEGSMFDEKSFSSNESRTDSRESIAISDKGLSTDEGIAEDSDEESTSIIQVMPKVNLTNSSDLFGQSEI